MKSLELEKMDLVEMTSTEMEQVEGGDNGYRPGMTFGDSYWFGPSSGYIDSSGFHSSRPADWVDISFGPSAF